MRRPNPSGPQALSREHPVLAVYPHLTEGGLVASPDPRIVQFGWPLGVPLPPISGGLLYQPNAKTPPVYVPFP